MSKAAREFRTTRWAARAGWFGDFSVRQGTWLGIFLSICFLVLASNIQFNATSAAQTPQRNDAHTAGAKDAFTYADKRLVERAIGATCTERIRDPFGSTPIDEMQTRPSSSKSKLKSV